MRNFQASILSSSFKLAQEKYSHLCMVCVFNFLLSMPRKSSYLIVLSTDEVDELRKRASAYSSPYYVVLRAKMILMAAKGMNNTEIAERLDTRREVVSRWRCRFYQFRLEGLHESPRSGRPRLEDA